MDHQQQPGPWLALGTITISGFLTVITRISYVRRQLKTLGQIGAKPR